MKHWVNRGNGLTTLSDESETGYLKEMSRIPSKYSDCTLDNFIVGENTKAIEKVKEWVELSMADTFEANKFLIIAGTVGTGKTHIACAIGNKYLKEGIQVVFLTTSELLSEFIRRYSGAYSPPHGRDYIGGDINYKTTPSELMEWLSAIDVLILDDIGCEYSPTDWAPALLDELVNKRYSNCKTIIFTTNTDKLPVRLKDRMSEGLSVVLKGDSFRRKISAAIEMKNPTIEVTE